MTINLNKIKEGLHVITITGFIVAVFFQLRKLYLYGGSISTVDESDDKSAEGENIEYREEEEEETMTTYPIKRVER